MDDKKFQKTKDSESTLRKGPVSGQAPGQLPDTDLRTTVGAFSTQIQRKIKEQEFREGEAEQATQVRHNTMLKALMSIRKSLIDITRIDLGPRFFYELDADDAQGWPRLRILLKDSQNLQAEYPTFQVSAHDRNALGLIEVAYDAQQKPEGISLANEDELSRLPSALKKCARTFLDKTAEIVLTAKNVDLDEEERKYLEEKNLKQMEEFASSHDLDEIFVDDNILGDFLERLPEMDNIAKLPDIGTNTPPKLPAQGKSNK